jgi:hypothetical protein
MEFYVEESGPPLWSQFLATEWRCFVSCEVQTKFIYVEESRPPLWSSGQSSWLQIQRSGFDSWRYQMFREVESGTGSNQPHEYN